MIEDILKKKRQTKLYDVNNIPKEDLIKSLIDKTFDLVPSKQNLLPYKVHILGPKCIEYKNILFDLSNKMKGGDQNYNLRAPYVLLFTRRLVTNPNPAVERKIKLGHRYGVCDPSIYYLFDKDVGIEVGMFSKILSILCLENNIDISYILCFSPRKDATDWKKLDFLNEDVLFSMQLGYKSKLFKYERKEDEIKPKKNEIINWL